MVWEHCKLMRIKLKPGQKSYNTMLNKKRHALPRISAGENRKKNTNLVMSCVNQFDPEIGDRYFFRLIVEIFALSHISLDPTLAYIKQSKRCFLVTCHKIIIIIYKLVCSNFGRHVTRHSDCPSTHANTYVQY